MPDTPDQVTIVNDYRYTTYPVPNRPVVMVATTYQKGMLPPRTVYIEEAKLTDQALREAIKADMEQAVDEAPKYLKL